MKRPRKSALGLSIALALASTGRLAGAEAPEEAAQAQRDFEAGVAASERGDFPSARILFQASAQRAARPSTWINLVVVDLRLSLLEEAQLALDALDGLLATAEDNPQRERFAARAAALRREVQEELARRTALQRAARPEEPTRPPELPVLRAEPPPPAPSPLVPRLMAGVGGVLGVSAIGTGAIWWRTVERNLDDCYGEGGELCLELEQISRQRRFAMHTTVTLGSVAVALGIGSAAWLLHLRHERERAAPASGSQRAAVLRPTFAPRAIGLELRGVF
jgi:hypothetical protein